MSDVCVRPVGRQDLPGLVNLCREHAEYERATWREDAQLERLAAALFGEVPRLYAWLAEERGEMLGYASATIDFSTWSARPYIHMDCLYLRAIARGRAIGRRLIEALVQFGSERGIDAMQWQTPTWNEGAIRFYARLQARSQQKTRFTLSLRTSRASTSEGR